MKNWQEKFWSKIDRSAGANGCWLWMAGTSCGYGTFRFEGKRTAPHRLVWLLLIGEIPVEKKLIHECQNHLCCNPKHMILVDTMAAEHRGRIEERTAEMAAYKVAYPPDVLLHGESGISIA